ncbi:MAG: hypothetical protein ACE14W_00610 [Candidatus Velamenicoccus archaeovorus]
MVISYTGEPLPELDPGKQRPSSRQVDTYSCGHEVVGPPLSRADGSLDVERRSSEETVEPRPRRR